MNDLTLLQAETLRLVAEGLTNHEIAARLHYSPNYMSSGNGFMAQLYHKLGIPKTICSGCKRAILVHRAHQLGYL